MKAIIIVAGIVLFLFAIGSYEHMVWRECLTTNSFFYCMRVLSH